MHFLHALPALGKNRLNYGNRPIDASTLTLKVIVMKTLSILVHSGAVQTHHYLRRLAVFSSARSTRIDCMT